MGRTTCGERSRRGGRTWVVLAIGVGLSSAASSAECGPVDDEQRTSHRELSWADFRVPRRFEAGPTEARARAEIAVSLGLDAWEPRVAESPDGTLSARTSSACVRAYVHKQRSARASQRQRGDLAHEQGHFDVAQLFVPVLEARLAALAVRVASEAQAREALLPEVRRVYRETALEMQALQARYERETNFGNERGPQARWKRELAKQLGAPSPQQQRASAEIARFAASLAAE